MIDGKGGTILILEDDEGVALLERRRLERGGYDVALAASPAEAERRLARGDIDLLILDYRLDASTNGLDFHRKLRELGFDVPSVLVTGFSDETMLAEAIRSGIRDFLPKTADYLDFLSPTVERVLKQVRTERQLAASQAELAALAERSRNEQALREAQEWLRLMIESVRDYAIFALDPQGGIASWNTGAERVFGYPESEILGKSFEILYVPEDRAEGRPAQELAAAATNGRAEDERWHLRKDGGRFFASGMVTPMRDAQGRLVGFTKVARDVTERMKAEAALRASEAALKETDRRKNEFLAMLAHELRNPLSAISGALQVTRQECTPEDQQWASEVFDRQVKHLAHLIDDLLDVSRISRGKVQLRRQVLQLRPIVERAVQTVRPALDKKRHTVTVTIPDEPISLDADPTRLEQIVVNLLSNAAKYTDPGGKIELTIGIEEGEAFIRVEDNGEGIPPEMQQQVFDLFVQMDQSLDRSQGGLGIGLTLVRTLSLLHGGRVELASSGVRGEGSKFTVRLPVVGRPAEAVTPRPEPPSPKSGLDRSLRILIVDDNADVARALARVLKGAGHDVRVVYDGEEALIAADEFVPELFLLDIGLPKLDGYQLAQHIRSNPIFANSVLVAISGYGMPQDRIRSKESGFHHHLVKPVYPEELAATLAEIQRFFAKPRDEPGPER